jgi:hypothetical protein
MTLRRLILTYNLDGSTPTSSTAPGPAPTLRRRREGGKWSSSP